MAIGIVSLGLVAAILASFGFYAFGDLSFGRSVLFGYGIGMIVVVSLVVRALANAGNADEAKDSRRSGTGSDKELAFK